MLLRQLLEVLPNFTIIATAMPVCKPTNAQARRWGRPLGTVETSA
jgi:hypothetical protein